MSKEVCKRVPVKEEANMEVEKCTRFPKEVSRRELFGNMFSWVTWQVCKDREVKVPRVTCEEEKDVNENADKNKLEK